MIQKIQKDITEQHPAKKLPVFDLDVELISAGTCSLSLLLHCFQEI